MGETGGLTKGSPLRGSLRLGTVSGIDIGLHWSIALIVTLLTITLSGTILPAFAAGFSGAAYLVAALATSGLFLASIVAHELGHSIVAQNNGIKVNGITLFALGGVAALDREPSNPGMAARIALAGPAVSVAIGVGSLVAAGAAGVLGFSALLVAGLAWLGLTNLVLAVFNMIPALPLDGGRVLQAALWKRSGNQYRATIGAARVGRYLGWGLVAFGIWQLTQGVGGLWTILIGFFVITSASAESVRARFQLQRQTMHDAMARFVGPWPPPDPSAHRPGYTNQPGRPYPGPATPGHQHDVIDVDSREVDTPGVR